MNKTFRILEITWLVIGIVCILLSVYAAINKDNQSAIYFLIITVLSGVMYAVRKRQRKNYEEYQKNNKK